MKKLEDDKFAVKLLAKGSFVDNTIGDNNLYLVETYTLRLNHIALNEFILSSMFNTRDCYETEEEWEAHKAKYNTKRETWTNQIIKALEINSNIGSISISQSQSEVFTVVHIEEIEQKHLTTV